MRLRPEGGQDLEVGGSPELGGLLKLKLEGSWNLAYWQPGYAFITPNSGTATSSTCTSAPSKTEESYRLPAN